MSLRDQLDRKARRRVVVPVQVSDPAQDDRRAADARRQLALARVTPGMDPDALAELERLVEETTTALAAHFVDVAFVALRGDDFEALIAAHTGDDGDLDRDRMRPALAAACAEDESLRDPDWWAEQFASDEWSAGERDNLYNRLFTELNYSVPSGGIPKG